MHRKLLVLVAALSISSASQAIIIIPIPNLAFPPPLSKIRDALEKSSETKALATVGEHKTFGSRQWVWGQAAGKMTQADANAEAMRKCEATLENAKRQTAGGQPIYNFGSNHCELYKFTHVTLTLPDPAPAPAVSQPSVPATAPANSATPAPTATTPAPSALVVASAAPAPVQPVPLAPTPTAASSAAVEPAAAPASRPRTNTDIVQKMKDLDILYKQNLITKDEYERKKKQLIDEL